MNIAKEADHVDQMTANPNESATPSLSSKPETNILDMSYESRRELLKLGFWMSAYLMFQSTVGISVFCLHKPMHDAGIIWSFFLSCLCCYITTYGLLTILNLTSQIEKDNQLTRRLQNLYSTTRYLQGPHITPMKWIMTVASVGMMFSSTVSNLIMTTQSLSYVLSRFECTFVIWFIISLLLIIIVEPEKLKNFTTVTTVLVVFVALTFTFLNFQRFFSGNSNVKLSALPLVDYSNTFGLTGNLIYAFELCSCYLSLRYTSSEMVDYSKLTGRMMAFITLVYYLVACSFTLAFTGDEMHENAFRIYDKGWLKYASFAYIINTVYNFIVNSIFACEAFETNGWVRTRLVDSNNRVKRKNIVMLRLAMWTITVITSLVCGTTVTGFLNFSGSVFSPLVGFIGPLVYFYTYKANRGERVLPGRKLHDLIYMAICLVIAVMGIRNAFV